MGSIESADRSFDLDLRSSSTLRRTSALKFIREKLVDQSEDSGRPVAQQLQIDAHPASAVNEQALLSSLFATYPLYVDRASQREVQACLAALLVHSPPLLPSLVRLLSAESAKASLAPSNAFVLIRWTELALEAYARDSASWKGLWETLILAEAALLDLVFASDGRTSLKRSAHLVTSQALRRLFTSSSIGDEAAEATVRILASKTTLGSKVATLLGLVAEAGNEPAAVGVIRDRKNEFFAFWTREVIGSKSILPPHVASSFSYFFSFYVTLDDLQDVLAPALEKSILRAPEIALSGLIGPMFSSLPVNLDLSGVLRSRLMKPLLTNLRSTNVVLRNGATDAFRVILPRCKEEANVEPLLDEFLTILAGGKLSADQKTACCTVLESISPSDSRSRRITQALSELVQKEPNETVTATEAQVLTTHTVYLLQHSKDTGKIVNLYSKSLSHSKPSVQRLWTVQSGNLLWNLRDTAQPETFKPAYEALVPQIENQFKETVSNPIAAAQSGMIVAAYVLLSLSGRPDGVPVAKGSVNGLQKRSRPIDSALSSEAKSSLLLTPRYYTKLSREDDFIWFLRALSACSGDAIASDPYSGISKAWSQALIYIAIARTVPPSVKRNAILSINRIYESDPSPLGLSIIHGLWDWFYDMESGSKDSASVAADSGMHGTINILRTICPPSHAGDARPSLGRASLVGHQLIEMLVLSQPTIVTKANWIDLCLRVGQDPGDLVTHAAQACLDRVNSVLDHDQKATCPSATTKHAAYSTFADLAFVAPDAITPLLVRQILHELDAVQVATFTPTDYAIARTEEGSTFVDVLSSKATSERISKSSSDYDILKWEAEVRAQVAAKKGQAKKLTTDDQAKVDAQLAKEQTVRERVLEVRHRIARGLGLVQGLATGPPTKAAVWMGPSLQSLITLVKAGVGLLVGDIADQAYIACANLTASRLGLLRPFIGVATLRALGSKTVPTSLSEEPLARLVTRVLYRLRLAGEQRPFDTVSLLYILPLLMVILENKGVGAQGDDADEQVTLALEFLAIHSDSFSDPSLSRSHVLEALIRSMQDFTKHHKLIKDCVVDMTRAITETASLEELRVLLKGTIVPQASVRAAVLQAINEHADLTSLDFCEEIWISCHDDEEENAEMADAIWQENVLEVSPQDAPKLLPYLNSLDISLRRATSRAIAACVARDTTMFHSTLAPLQEQYRELAKPREPEKDAFGIVKKTNLRDPWEGRHGIALAFKELAPAWVLSELLPFTSFLIDEGALGDRNATVRDAMIDSATAVIANHGKAKIEELMAAFEGTIASSAKDEGESDQVSEAVIILYGAVARHLPAGDKRIGKVLDQLLDALATPSESVQFAVANCLPALIRNMPEKTSDCIQRTLEQTLISRQYAARRGAAYGLAGIVTGRGIATLREFRIMSSLKAAVENKKDVNHRQGALFAYELLSTILGKTFEPYVIQIVPQLIATFGDASADVREACLDASKVCFSNLSSYGVKIILPMLLEGLDETQWRSKKGACDLLGAMAYLDPQHLAQSLPDIIPPLTGVLSDSHKEVRASANRSLQRFGEVISNPEVKSLVNVLLKALSDPTKHTEGALDSLIKVSFVHYLDAPSLALVVRILERGLGDRSGTKRKAAQIIGSLAHLTERKDLTIHLPILVEGLRLAVVDPVPATRATSSKALGSLVEKLGEDALPDLIPSLMATLKSDVGAGDRLGSAQALGEVLAGLGTTRLEEALPSILQNATSRKTSVREGFMSLFIFLPACFGNSFANYLSKIIPPILNGLADEVESIRETALRAGRLLVKNFATKSIDLLLPELDRGLADDSYRIRLSSVELVGDLLFSLTGVTMTEENDEDEDRAQETGQSLLDVLGEEKRNKILSSLYICRCDTSGLVRSAAINVWKALVASPRTLKELVPTLSQTLIRRLASSNPEQKLIAGNALGELIRKAGESILSTLLPTLQEELDRATDPDSKQGICIALREVISAASPDSLGDYEDTLISVVRTALVDPDDEVRESAAEAFDSLQRVLGKRAVDHVLPHLLSLLRTEGEADQALSALLTLLTDNTRSNVILPNLIPTLLTTPMTAFNARAIASLSRVASSSISRRLPAIINALVDNIVVCKDEALQKELQSTLDTVLVSADEYDGLNTVMSVMLALVKHDDHKRRAEAAERLGAFFNAADVDFSRYYPDLVRVLLLSFDDRDTAVVHAACAALTDLMKRLRKEEMESLVNPTRQVVQQVGVAGHDLPGFCLPKGINSVLPIFLQGLMNGSAEQRTQAALALSDIVDRTSADALKPFVTNITGPLIRVVSEKSTDLKCAILLTLNNLLDKIPLFVKPFLPQLQRTFAKCLADPGSDLLRARAAKALGTLLNLKPRIDPLIAELVTGTKTPDAGVRNAMLKALYEVVSKAGENMSETSRNAVLGLIDSELGDDNESMAITYARLLGALVKSLPAPDANSLIKHRALSARPTQSSVLNLNSIFVEAPTLLLDSFADEVVTLIARGVALKQLFLADNFVLAAGKYLLYDGNKARSDTFGPILEPLAAIIGPGNAADTRRLALVVTRTLSRAKHTVVQPHLALLAPPVFASVRDVIIPVKLAAEAAFVGLFDVIESESAVFDEYMQGPGADLSPATKRSMQDYFRRVALRLAAQAKERREAEGGSGELGLSSDEQEDEREIWSVGKMEIGNVFSQD